ncbi:hypothetical protein ACFVHB_38830 [Kitasatospora sp. NPDC127111]|uniref:hypothetical protein n=1 Tax=Kitasatospora sp. NPDC127111 TaxID=3345363 RepID=UPI00362EDEB3
MSDSPRPHDGQGSNDPLEPADLPPLDHIELSIPDFPTLSPDKPVIRAVPHHDELNPRGTVILCEECKAGRDWLLLNVRQHVFVRCRCGHEWLEGDLTVEYFEQHFSAPEIAWDDFETAMASTGYDGAWAGMYLN